MNELEQRKEEILTYLKETRKDPNCGIEDWGEFSYVLRINDFTFRCYNELLDYIKNWEGVDNRCLEEDIFNYPSNMKTKIFKDR